MRIPIKPTKEQKPYKPEEITSPLGSVIDVSNITPKQLESEDLNAKLKKLFQYLNPTDNGLYVNGTMKSSNFVRNLKGWGINVNKEGDAFFKTVTAGAYIKVFVQASVPTSENINDIWYDSDDSYKQYYAVIKGATTIAAGQWVASNYPTNWGDVVDDGNKPEDNAMDLGNHEASELSAARNYEAVVDVGGEGDYTTIQAAITAGATKIFVRSGTYTVGSDITIATAGTVIIGEDRNATILDFNNAAYQLHINQVSDCQIKNITLKNSTDANGALYVHGEAGNQADNTIIDNCILGNGNTVKSLIIGLSAWCEVTNCIFLADANIISLQDDGQYTKIQGCNFDHSGTSDGTAIRSTSAALILNNTFNNPAIAIRVTGATEVIGNYIYNITDKGIYILTTQGNVGGNALISGNHIELIPETKFGIYIEGGDYNTISGNSIYGVGSSIKILTGSTNNIISNNPLLSASGSGKKSIVLDSGSVDTIVTGNNLVSGITDSGTTTKLDWREIQCIVYDFTSDIATGDGKFYFHIDKTLDVSNLVYVHAEVITAGTTGTTDIQIYNIDNAVDMLSTKLTINSGETGSDTATAAVINASNDHVDLNDVIRIDVDAVATTAPKGLIVTLGFIRR